MEFNKKKGINMARAASKTNPATGVEETIPVPPPSATAPALSSQVEWVIAKLKSRGIAEYVRDYEIRSLPDGSHPYTNDQLFWMPPPGSNVKSGHILASAVYLLEHENAVNIVLTEMRQRGYNVQDQPRIDPDPVIAPPPDLFGAADLDPSRVGWYQCSPAGAQLSSGMIAHKDGVAYVRTSIPSGFVPDGAPRWKPIQ